VITNTSTAAMERSAKVRAILRSMGVVQRANPRWYGTGAGDVGGATADLQPSADFYFLFPFVQASVTCPSVISLLFSSQEYSRISWPGFISTNTRVLVHGLV
jgi:hypothetical protein